jgi:hypothetical protein
MHKVKGEAVEPCPEVTLPPGHPLHDHFVERYRTLRARLVEVLRRHREAGGVAGIVDLEAAAREIIATLDGLHLQWLLDPGSVNLLEALTAYGDRLTADLAPAAPSHDG